jgi:ABC-type branched-subunit amino acid transport system substrate-binding protein
LLDLSRKAGRTSADTAHAASDRSLTTLVADLARTESKVVIIACHGKTIGSQVKAYKGQTARRRRMA